MRMADDDKSVLRTFTGQQTNDCVVLWEEGHNRVQKFFEVEFYNFMIYPFFNTLFIKLDSLSSLTLIGMTFETKKNAHL